MSDSWYERVTADAPLTQGDVITECPVLSWRAEPIELHAGTDCADVLKAAVQAVRANVIVMTQACDLAHHKVANIILCPHVSLSNYKEQFQQEMRAIGQNPTDKAWRTHCRDITDGFVWNLTILNAGKTGDISTEHLIVDFHEVFTVPRAFLESFLSQRVGPRLRLRPPYREHLSQAFARFFMRVGLPTSVDKVW